MRLTLALLFLFPLSAGASEFSKETNDYIKRVMARYHVPGLSVGIARRDGTTQFASFGERNAKTHAPVDPDTLFCMASICKSFGSAAIGLLVDRGQVKLDQPLSEYVPGFKLFDPEASRKASLVEVMSHTTGMPFGGAVVLSNAVDREWIDAHLEFVPNATKFGTQFGYSNVMYSQLGRVIQSRTGRDVFGFIESEVLAPLGMHRSSMNPDVMTTDANVALPYTSSVFTDAREEEQADLRNATVVGSLYSSARDMTRWVLMSLRGGMIDDQHRLMKKETLDMLQAPHIRMDIRISKEPEFKDISYAMGWWTGVYRGHKMISQSGSTKGYLTTFVFFPELDFGFVLMINAMGNGLDLSYFTWRIADELLGVPAEDWLARLEEKPVPETDPDCVAAPLPEAAYLGTYESPAYGPMRIIAGSNGLTLDYFKPGSIFSTGENTLCFSANGDFTLRNNFYGARFTPVIQAGNVRSITWHEEHDLSFSR
jgi:CubicO group peptidase (beta-lactamase class C family)